MEREFNSINQKVIARGLGTCTSGKVRVVLDDDKIHCENKTSPWHSLKRKKHVQSNRWGVTLHSLVVSGSGIVVNIHAEKDGENTEEIIQKCMSTFAERNYGKPNLSSLILNMDRGYNSAILSCSKSILCHGGTVEGTLKRSFETPLTYDQTLNGIKDKRTNIRTEGPDHTFRRETLLKDGTKTVGKLVVFGFRDSKGKCTLMGSTDPLHHTKDIYDFQPKPNHGIDASDPSSIFKPHPICSKILDNNDINIMKRRLYELIKDKCQPLTYTQGGREWFHARKFALTASQGETQISIGLRSKDYKSLSHWQRIADVVKHISTPPPVATHATTQDARDWAEQLFHDKDFCSQLGDYDGFTKHLEKKLKDALMEATGQSSVKKASLWCNTEPAAREFFGYSLTQLKKELVSRAPTNTHAYKMAKKKQIHSRYNNGG
jgi:hypothetical protein